MTTPCSHRTQAAGTVIHYVEAGEGPATVVLVHGLGSSSEVWDGNIAGLARGRRVLALDLPGHGRSPLPPTDLTPGYLALVLKEFLVAVRVERCGLVGASLGGAVALQHMPASGDRVEKLVLVASAGLGRELHAGYRATAMPGLGEALTTPTRKGVRQYLTNVYFDGSLVTDKAVESAFERASRPGAQETLLRVLRASVDIDGQRESLYRPILDRLGALRVPVLIVWGENDIMVPPEHGRRAAAAIPNARLHVIPACGHVPNVEHQQEFDRVLCEFLDQ